VNDAVTIFVDQVNSLVKSGVATEHSYRPAVKTLLESLVPNVVAVNEPKRVECGAPDFSVNLGHGRLIGYVECKDVGVHLESIASSDQIRRYRRALSNLIVTNHTDFWWYLDSELKDQASLGRTTDKGLVLDSVGTTNVIEILTRFLNQTLVGASSAEELASRLARLTHLLRDVIFNSIQADAAPSLSDLLKACRDTILPEVTTQEFADVFAQTLSYGLFAARLHHDDTSAEFTRYSAVFDIPKSNPFLRDLFEHLAGPAMDDEPYVGLVEDVASMLAQTKKDRILRDFGSPKLRKDPILHFYETFLAVYDPDIREQRGVYYTPLPIVEYIVNSLDRLLKEELLINDGLASAAKSLNHPASHEVLVLDPACGTGTFLYAVIDKIRAQFMETDNAGLWPSSALHDLLPRLVGLELLMAPYALAHMKLGMQFSALDLPPAERDNWAVPIPSDSRLRVYLTNSLVESSMSSPLPLGQWISAEANAAASVKSVEPVLVVLGNPPYQGDSRNRGEWIKDRVSAYRFVDGVPLRERQLKWLQDDYVKFIAFAEWRINETGRGLVGFVVNHAFIDNPTFRGLRHHLLETFDAIWVLDMHGSTRRKEVRPVGVDRDDPVFDIQQGTAVLLMAKGLSNPDAAKVHHADLWGTRSCKYEWLLDNNVRSTEWTAFRPSSPSYRFDPPQSGAAAQEWDDSPTLEEIFPLHNVGFVSGRDKLVVDFDAAALRDRINRIAAGIETPENVARTYGISEEDADKVATTIRKNMQRDQMVVPCLYRTFDDRSIYFDPGALTRPVMVVQKHLLSSRDNVALIAPRQVAGEFRHAFVTDKVTNFNAIDTAGSRGAGQIFPLYLVEEESSQGTFVCGRRPNVALTTCQSLSSKLGMRFAEDKSDADLSRTSIGVLDLAGYCYAVMNSIGYRDRYAALFRDSYPRIPITSEAALFWDLVFLGRRLMDLHLMRASDIRSLCLGFPVVGSNKVASGYPKFVSAAHEPETGKVYLSPDRSRLGIAGQYFDGVRFDAWMFTVGGYQVLHRYLTDRRGRSLTAAELSQYQRIHDAIDKSLDVVSEIDTRIGEWPLP
jgi:hypothetical protein